MSLFTEPLSHTRRVQWGVAAALFAASFTSAGLAFHTLTREKPRAQARELKSAETREIFSVFRGQDSSFSGQSNRVFTVRKGDPDAIIAGFDPAKNDKLRVQGFGVTSAAALRSMMREEGGDVVLNLPSGPTVRFTKTTIGALPDASFQLELDRGSLIETFADDFNTFSWYSEGMPQGDGKGVWRTNYGWGSPAAEGSRSLPGNQQVYVDPAFRGTGQTAFGLNPFHLANGVLEIWAEPASDALKPYIWGRQYTSGLITSKFSFSQLYGVFEIRARMPKGRGFWPAFWLLPSDSTWPPEIDVLEVLCHDTATLYTAAHSQASGEHTSQGSTVPAPDLSADFHQYAVDWRKDEIRWYLDGVEVARAPTPADMHKPMYLLANLGVGGDWPGNPDASTRFPGVLAIDWIRAYRHKDAVAER